MKWLWLLKNLIHMFPKELGHSLRKVYCSLRKLVFPKITIMSLGRKNFFPFTIWLFMGQLKPYFLWEHGCSLGNNLNPFLTWKCVFIHFIHEWKNNARKGSNPRPLGYKGDSNHYISIFPLKIIFRKIFKPFFIVQV